MSSWAVLPVGSFFFPAYRGEAKPEGNPVVENDQEKLCCFQFGQVCLPSVPGNQVLYQVPVPGTSTRYL